MEKQGIEPDGIMLMSIVSMCTHEGLMKEGCAYFERMVMKLDGYIIPMVEHYNCIVDLLARVGCVEEAESVLLTMPIPPDSVTWTSLLTSCNAFRNMDVGSRCLLHVQDMDLVEGASAYLLSHSA
jgi:pentatricopeptide repeat protein